MINNSFNNDDDLNLYPAELLLADADSNLGDLVSPKSIAKNESLGAKPDRVIDLETISQAATQEAYRHFQDFTSKTNWQNQIDDIFGTGYSVEALEKIVDDLHANNLTSFPKIQIVDADRLQGANGGYNSRDSLIYLADSFLTDNLNNLDAVTRVVLEEVGHFIDAEVNLEDSPGDEGEKFVKRLFGEEFNVGLLAEDDTRVITVNNEQVTIEQSNEDLAGNSLATARDLGVFTGTQTFTDRVSGQDRNDYYKFNLDTSGTVSFALTGLNANANIVLLDSAGDNIIGSWRPGTKSEYQVKEDLPAGDYYLRVVRWWGNTSYDLSLTFDGAGDNLAAARDLGTFTGTQTFKDSISSQDRNDYYKFSLDTSGSVRFALTGLNANANIVLLDSAGNNIIGSWRPGTKNEYQIAENLDAGDYYLRVVRWWGNTNYDLSLTFDGAGDNLAAARDLGTFTGTQTFEDSISSQDPNDYYKFSLDTSGKASFALTGLSANANIVLLDSTGKGIIGSWNSGTKSEYRVREDLPAGDYYLRVVRKWGRTNYDLSLDVETYPVWQAEYFNNTSVTGTPVFTETIADARTGIDVNWLRESPDSAVNTDNFSARFTSTSVFETGLYNFVSQADDGVRVYVDDIKVIDKWNTANPWSRHDAYIAIPEGEHTVVIEYYEQAGIAGQKLLWSKTELDVDTDSLHPVAYNGTGIHQTYFNTYERNGSIEQLGYPLNNVHPWGNGYVQDFTGGINGDGSIMKSNANDDSYWVGGEIWDTYLSTGGAEGILNYPISDVYETEGGRRQDFLGGVIFQSEEGTFPIYGGIGGKYLYLGGETSFLGFPTSNEIGIGDGWVIQHFEGGDILYKDGQPTVAFDTRVNENLPEDSGNGSTDKWHVQYWNNKGFTGNAVWSETLEPGELIFAAGLGAPTGSRGVTEDNFSARWTTTSYFEGGLYDFISQADDGVRIYVDDELVIDKWHDSPFETRSKEIKVEQGYHNIRVDYYEHLGGAANTLRWEQVSSLDDWTGEIYQGQSLAPNNFVKFGTQDSGALDLDWGRGGPLPSNDVYISDRVNNLEAPANTWQMKGMGDFNGDGDTDAIWQNHHGIAEIWLMNDNLVAEKVSLDFLSANDVIQGAGDFDGDGDADILVRQSEGMVSALLMEGTDFIERRDIKAASTASVIRATGDFNQDGITDILWRRVHGEHGIIHVWMMDDVKVSLGVDIYTPATSDWEAKGTGDINNDGHTDIIWRHKDGEVSSWLMNGTQILDQIVLEKPGLDWRLEGVGDINNESHADIIWRHQYGAVRTWLLDTSIGGDVFIGDRGDYDGPSNNWAVRETADFNQDGHTDFIWQNDRGTAEIWLMNDNLVTEKIELDFIDSSWRIRGAGDFNDDGSVDLVWRDETGMVHLSFMDGLNLIDSTSLEAPSSEWRIRGAGDFNDNGYDDILLRHTDGSVHLWLIENDRIVGRKDLESPGLDWHIRGVGDLNADGQDDILWRNDNGWVHSWLIDNLEIVGRNDYEAPTSDWKILGVGDVDNEGHADILWRHDSGVVHSWLLNTRHDDFSDRWTTTQYFEQAGVYEFTSLADDGVRVWVNGRLAIDKWGEQSSVENKFLMSLDQGYHLIQVEHFENLGAAVNKLSWSKLPGIVAGHSVGLMDLDLSGSSNTLYAEPWVGEYFNNKTLSGAPVLTRMEEFKAKGFLDLDWNLNSPAPQVHTDNFSARWTTQKYLPEGTYTFNVGSDDGVRFYLNGERVIDQWVDRGFATNQVTVTLPQGTHQLQLDYYEYVGPAAAKLTWDYAPNDSSFAIATDNAGQVISLFQEAYERLVADHGIGAIGIPTSDVEGIISTGIVTPGNIMLPSLEEVAKIQRFKGIEEEGALIQELGSDRAVYLHGAIWQAYEQAGGVIRLGVPTSNQKDLGNGAYELELADGIMFWKPGMTNPTLYKFNQDSLTIPSDAWRAEYFNNKNRSGDPTFVEGVGDYGQGFFKQWAASSPNPVVSSDNFSARLTSKRYLEPGLHQIKIGADDGAKVKIGDQWIINNGIGEHSGYFYSDGREYDIQVEYYELGGHAALNFEIDRATPVVEAVNNTTEWNASIFHWSKNGADKPPADFHHGGIHNPRYIGVVNLGSNANHGLNFNWGEDDAIKNNSDLPHDYYAVRAYTRVNLGGGEYKFNIKGDDGVQILIRETGTGNWHYVTPKDEWQHLRNSYGEYRYTLPSGQYDVHVQMYEHVGPAHFDFSYERLPITQPVDIHNQWNATIYEWDTSQGQPRQDFFNHKFIGQLKLDKPNGNSVRVNFGGNGGDSSLNNDSRLPKDNFAIRAYTQASFDGGEYNFNVQGDDGVQIFAKNIHTNQWHYITPKEQWIQAYGQRQFKASLPNGRYDLHFHMYEHGGLAQFNLDWAKVPEVPVYTGGGSSGGSLGGNAILSVQGAGYFKDRPEFYTTGNIFSNARYGSHLVDGVSYREGNCTWYAHGRVKELGGNVAALNSMYGNANQWHTQLSNGSIIVSDPQVGDIAQWDSNHVAVVEKVYFSNGVKRVILSESQWVDVDGIGGAGTLHRVVDYSASNPNRYIRVPGVSTNQNNGSVNDNVEEYNPSIPAPPDTPGSNEQINIRPDGVGNNKFSSLWLGELSDNQEINTREWINNYDKYDYYSFSVAERSRVNVSVNGMSDNLDLEILNWSSTLLKSDGWNNSTEFISKVLNPGERYYVKIYQGDSDATTGYNLDISIDTDDIGKLTIYSDNQGDINSNPFNPFNNLNVLVSGHSWLSYKVTDYVENNRATFIYEQNTTYGTWGNNPTGEGNGLFENLEKNFSYKASRYTSIDLREEKILLEQIDAYTEQGQDAWRYLSPCSSFANNVWRTVTGETLIPSGIWSTPTSLIKYISHKNGNSSSGRLT